MENTNEDQKQGVAVLSQTKELSKVRKVVLAYSGGLDTSVIVPWLKNNYGGCEVICMCANLGQADELDGLEEKALASGASKCYIEDLREEFITDYILPTLRAGAIYERKYLLGTSFARPIIARRQVEIAELEGADAVSHGATGKGNDQVRFELTYQALNPKLRVIAPWREWDIRSREDALDYAAEFNVPVSATEKSIYSRDRNIWHLSHEGGILEDPWNAPPEDIFQKTVSPKDAPDDPEEIELTFSSGNPVALNGREHSPASLLRALNELGCTHGIGRRDIVENRFVGMKSRGVYETPGGTILRAAHIAMESITMDREVLHLRDSLVPKYSELVYYGFWFSPEMKILQNMIDMTQQNVSGVVRLELYRGNCRILGRKSDVSLYREDFATFEDDSVYSQKDAEGFIRLNALRLRIQKMLEK